MEWNSDRPHIWPKKSRRRMDSWAGLTFVTTNAARHFAKQQLAGGDGGSGRPAPIVGGSGRRGSYSPSGGGGGSARQLVLSRPSNEYSSCAAGGFDGGLWTRLGARGVSGGGTLAGLRFDREWETTACCGGEHRLRNRWFLRLPPPVFSLSRYYCTSNPIHLQQSMFIPSHLLLRPNCFRCFRCLFIGSIL